MKQTCFDFVDLLFTSDICRWLFEEDASITESVLFCFSLESSSLLLDVNPATTLIPLGIVLAATLAILLTVLCRRKRNKLAKKYKAPGRENEWVICVVCYCQTVCTPDIFF